MTNLPPALIITCEYDLLQDQPQAHAQRLQEGGNQVLPGFEQIAAYVKSVAIL